MVTKEQALTCDQFHYTGSYGECVCHVGPRGGVSERITHVRRSGATKVWKRDPLRFRVPIKFGMYESGEITEDNCELFHTANECPLLREEN